MQLHISSDGPPIYQQIVDQIRFRIVTGGLPAGAELPTIRGLAESLQVNPNTVARAYRELENHDLVEKRRTKGTFVRPLEQKISASKRRQLIAPSLDRLLIQAGQLGISLAELSELLSKRHSQLESEKA